MNISIKQLSLLILLFNVTLIYAQEQQNIVPGAYIIQFSSSFKNQRTNNHHELFYQRMPRINSGITPVLNFTSSIFMGVSLRLTHPEAISMIKNLDSVAAVWPVTLYPRPDPVIQKITKPSNFVSAKANQNQDSTHVMTGVDRLHAEGYFGSNIRIAVIDSGVDYKHPALGGDFGAGHKVEFGRDLVGDDYTGSNIPLPDDDPLDCDGHGTHVSGIIGGEDAFFTGVAPNATLGMYRVFGCVGSVGNDVLIEAFLEAEKSGAQIISVSIGGTSGWLNNPLALVASNIAEKGVVCVVAAGNNGANGVFYASTPGNGYYALSVGSVTNTLTPIFGYQGQFTVDNESNNTFTYVSSMNASPARFSGYSLIALGFNTSNPADACDELPSNTSNMTGKIVLIRRGSCPFIDKIANVKVFGAEYVIFYNNESPLGAPPSVSGVYVSMVSAEQGAQWISYLKEGQTVKFYFDATPTTGVIYSQNNINGGAMSPFSSWSPTYELNIKPEVSAPGGNILSTYPIDQGSYSVSSGTSMATPYISGILALYMEAHGPNATLHSQVLRQILSTTSTPLPFNNGTHTFPYLAPVIQQGAGLVNAYAVVHYNTKISPSTLPLNDSVHFNETTSFTISNDGSTDVFYTLSHVPAATVYALGKNTTFPQLFPPDLDTESATVEFSFDNVTVPAQSVAVVNVTFSFPSTVESQRIPIISGYIKIESDENETFHLPYGGAACNMKEVKITDFERRPPYVSRYLDFSAIPTPIEENTTFYVIEDVPEFNWRMLMGSAIVRLDILGNGNQTEVLGVNILGSVPGFPVYWISRVSLLNDLNRYTAIWAGDLSNGVQLPAGSYKILYRVLKIFGNPDNNDDYESYTSPSFNIVRSRSPSTTLSSVNTTTTTATTTPLVSINATIDGTSSSSTTTTLSSVNTTTTMATTTSLVSIITTINGTDSSSTTTTLMTTTSQAQHTMISSVLCVSLGVAYFFQI